MQYITIQYSTYYESIQHNTIQYNRVQHNTTQYMTLQSNTIQCITNATLQCKQGPSIFLGEAGLGGLHSPSSKSIGALGEEDRGPMTFSLEEEGGGPLHRSSRRRTRASRILLRWKVWTPHPHSLVEEDGGALYSTRHNSIQYNTI